MKINLTKQFFKSRRLLTYMFANNIYICKWIDGWDITIRNIYNLTCNIERNCNNCANSIKAMLDNNTMSICLFDTYNIMQIMKCYKDNNFKNISIFLSGGMYR